MDCRAARVAACARRTPVGSAALTIENITSEARQTIAFDPILEDIPFELVPRAALLLLCSTPAGFPSPAQDDMEEPIDLAAWLIDHPAASYVMRVSGHSMVGAGIHDGDLVVVSRAVEARPGDIVVALVHGERTMKRLRKRADRLWLVPEAEGYERILVDENVEIWGIVAALARRYRQ